MDSLSTLKQTNLIYQITMRYKDEKRAMNQYISSLQRGTKKTELSKQLLAKFAKELETYKQKVENEK